jgi:glycosyltransferase involved in cell wall biosynthesis
MHILFLLTQDLESPSGVGRYYPMARELVRLGHRVTIAALHADFRSLDRKRFTKDGVAVWYVGQMHVLKRNEQKSYFSTFKLLSLALTAAWELARAAFRVSADVIHVGKPHPMNGVAGLTAKYLRGIPLFVDCDDYEAGSTRFKSSWQKSVVGFFERHIPRHAEIVTTHTRFMRGKLVGWGVPTERIVYIPNGVDLERFQPVGANQIENLRGELALGDKRVVAYVGSLSLPSHPVDLLVEAFSKVHAGSPDSVLLLVGGGEDFDTLQRKVKDSGLMPAVCFYGRVPPELVNLFYRLASVSVDPVRDDDAARGRSPLKLFESWACGVPFITAEVGDRPSLLGEPPAGVLVSPGDPDALAEAILYLLSHPEFAEVISQRGRARIEQYSWDHLVKQLESVYLDRVKSV